MEQIEFTHSQEALLNKFLPARIYDLSLKDDYDLTLELVPLDYDDSVYRVSIKFYHEQECCESVYLDDGLSDLRKMAANNDTIHSIQVTSESDPNADESGTYTFYRVQSDVRTAVLRWVGTSNGYYSEDVDVEVSAIYRG